MAQNIHQKDLILISDSGEPYVVIMKDDGTGSGGRIPHEVVKLDDIHADVPKDMRDDGVTLAVMPDTPDSDGGCSCFLLNLQSIRDAIHLPMSPARLARLRAARALRQGKTLKVPGVAGAPDDEIQI